MRTMLNKLFLVSAVVLITGLSACAQKQDKKEAKQPKETAQIIAKKKNELESINTRRRKNNCK